VTTSIILVYSNNKQQTTNNKTDETIGKNLRKPRNGVSLLLRHPLFAKAEATDVDRPLFTFASGGNVVPLRSFSQAKQTVQGFSSTALVSCLTMAGEV
jgi:hypothetical protein